MDVNTKKHLTAVRKLVKAKDPDLFRQGLALAKALNNPELWAALVRRRGTVKKHFFHIVDGRRVELDLWALRATGALNQIKSLRLRVFTDGIAEALNGLPRLRHLSLYFDPHSYHLDNLEFEALRHLPAVRSLELRYPESNGYIELKGIEDLTHLVALTLTKFTVAEKDPRTQIGYIDESELTDGDLEDHEKFYFGRERSAAEYEGREVSYTREDVIRSYMAELEDSRGEDFVAEVIADEHEEYLTNLEPIRGLTGLRFLSITDFLWNRESLDPLRNLTGLSALRLRRTYYGPGEWEGNECKVRFEGRMTGDNLASFWSWLHDGTDEYDDEDDDDIL